MILLVVALAQRIEFDLLLLILYMNHDLVCNTTTATTDQE